MKLQSKQRVGKKVCCVYDPAKTPLQRLLLSGVISAQKQQELIEVAQALDPIRLFQQIEQLQQAIFRCAVNYPPFVSSTPPAPLRIFSVEHCTAGNIPADRSVPDLATVFQTRYREQVRRKQVLGWRRTRKDPFDGEWEQILSWLVINPERPQRRHLPGIALPLTWTLSTITHPYSPAWDAEDPSSPAGNF